MRNYLSSAIGKTGTRNKTEAALLARRNGWLWLPEDDPARRPR